MSQSGNRFETFMLLEYDFAIVYLIKDIYIESIFLFTKYFTMSLIFVLLIYYHILNQII